MSQRKVKRPIKKYNRSSDNFGIQLTNMFKKHYFSVGVNIPNLAAQCGKNTTCLSVKKRFLKKKTLKQGTISACASLNLSPSNSYERYMLVINSCSDTKSIESDWRAVGEGLISARHKYLLETMR